MNARLGPSLSGLAGALALAVLGIATQAQTPATPPPAAIVSLWYRGTPAGTPRSDDLAVIRRAGFRGVTWPTGDLAPARELYRLAAALDLHTTVRAGGTPLTSSSALTPPLSVDINVSTTPPVLIGALAWRALAHGARVISLDAGRKAGSGLDADTEPPWLKPSQALASSVDTQSRLIDEWRPAGNVTFDAPAPAALDMALLSDARSWVLVVTNASTSKVHAVAHLPPGVPGALWVNLLDGALLSMITGPQGPKWTVDLEEGAARVYVVNR